MHREGIQIMESVNLFKIIQFITLIIFTAFISDLRKKKGMYPLISKKLIIAVKITYFVPISIYGYTLATLNYLLITDFVGLGIALLGTCLVVKAKTDIGEYHAWTGYQLRTTKLVTRGIYAFIRHPLYTGIYLFIFGTFLTLVTHAYWFLTTVWVIVLVYIMAVLAVSAARETKLLAQAFGDDFLNYKKQVHSFLPIRRFKE